MVAVETGMGTARALQVHKSLVSLQGREGSSVVECARVATGECLQYRLIYRVVYMHSIQAQITTIRTLIECRKNLLGHLVLFSPRQLLCAGFCRGVACVPPSPSRPT